MRQKEKVTAWIDGDLHRQMKIVAVQAGRTIQDCLNEALRQWLEEQRHQEQDTG